MIIIIIIIIIIITISVIKRTLKLLVPSRGSNLLLAQGLLLNPL